MSTPTVGSLRRRIERLEREQRQDVKQDVADLEARVEELERRIADLEARVEELERRIADLEAHVEELDERAGLSDESEEYEDNSPSLVEVDESDNEKLEFIREWRKKF